ncbi:glycoside hydrolase family 3 protein [Nocardioides mangrovi]|uniref:Glycoside hydrolase family 3 C-terminal domain-containing protein n=1 Tax=Nocardioides mangrovi TaxID=2874580 RepID=A0ABS7UIV0_9ACTN|nr:glycoside hydrolase family 3 C-terminal domain-containing protein [Nocardioides mangrovi]MBZ5740926.1 glycoside hydrolase family 3 C-terminal domain-containing protein [Nocardioides mangrovi]
MGDLEERVARLPVERKVRLLTGASMFTLRGDDEIGLREMAFSDGPTGVRGLDFTGGPLTCLFPNATLLASSWRTETAEEVGRLLAEEAERQEIHVVLGPTVNLHRTPLGGRLFEAYSEDPLLTGHLAAAYVRGLQAQGIGACVKHLVANEAETERHTVDSVVDERTLRELYLLPFEIAVEDADPWSVMAAYNDVNGVPATEHQHVNNEVLKQEWGWDGLLMSDWFATKSAGPAANGGLDLVMPGPVGPWGPALTAAVESGEVAEATVDDHLRRLLGLAQKVGALDSTRTWRTDLPAPDSDVRREQLTRLAAEGMTVLSNDGTLPLTPDRTAVLIGRPVRETTCMGGGSASVRAPHQVSIADAMPEVTVVDGVAVRARPRAGRTTMRVQRYGASGAQLSDEVSAEAKTVGAMPDQELAEPVTRVVMSTEVPAGAMRVGFLGVGTATLSIGDERHEVTLGSESDDIGGDFLRPPGWQTDVVLDHPTELAVDITLGAWSGLGLVVEPTPPTDDEAIAAAAAAAAAADVAVVVVGLTEEQETEAFDKSTLALPGRQDELVSAVAAAARRTVVVVNAATPVLMPWRDEVAAILWAGLPGQEGGHAVAAALRGEVEPAGRLVTSFPVADGASPAWDVVPTDGRLSYDEGVFVGYRGYAARKAPAPAYWFGHGLGYGEWEYGDAALDGDTLTADLTNVGARPSREVVQVYLQPDDTDEPIRLVGRTTADLAPGERRRVDVTLDRRAMRTWTDAGWRPITSGTLHVARGLGDLRGEVRLTPPSR